jgi:hypothetical protein
MALRDELQRKLDKKRAEIAGLESALASAKSYAQALEDTLKMMPRDDVRPSVAITLRHGTALYQAREAILKAGKPLHIGALMSALGKEDTKENRVSLVGSLGTYVRQGKIFSRPGPNVFGLLEMAEESTEQEGEPRLRVAS